jgi:hypothetical protein
MTVIFACPQNKKIITKSLPDPLYRGFFSENPVSIFAFTKKNSDNALHAE